MKKILIIVALLLGAWVAGTAIAVASVKFANASLADEPQTVQSTEKVQATMRVQVTDDAMQKTASGSELQPAYNVNLIK